MSQNDIVAPVAKSDTSQCTITSPWFIQDTEYPPALATYKPLVNGEEAFAAVHHAIANAQKTVDIICWGFQPSMYFIRNGQEPCIGELLCKIAEGEKKSAGAHSGVGSAFQYSRICGRSQPARKRGYCAKGSCRAECDRYTVCF